jgi:hypothetical protein
MTHYHSIKEIYILQHKRKRETQSEGADMGSSASVPTENSIHQFTVKVTSIDHSLLLYLALVLSWALFILSNLSFLLFYGDIFQDARGNDVDLSIFKGKVLLVVNVASKWYQIYFPCYSKFVIYSSDLCWRLFKLNHSRLALFFFFYWL